MEIDMFSMR